MTDKDNGRVMGGWLNDAPSSCYGCLLYFLFQEVEVRQIGSYSNQESFGFSIRPRPMSLEIET